MIELDHAWFAPADPPAAIAALQAAGLVLGARGEHQGQGTANAVFFFDNAYLELLWCTDPALLDTPRNRPTGLRQRLAGGRACPFGLSFRRAAGAPDAPLPLPTWDWPAAFLPPGAVPIPIATPPGSLAEPIVFASLVTRRPDLRPVARQAELREISAVRFTLIGGEKSGVPARLEALGLATFVEGARWRMEVEVDDGQSGGGVEVEGLVLRW